MTVLVITEANVGVGGQDTRLLNRIVAAGVTVTRGQALFENSDQEVGLAAADLTITEATVSGWAADGGTAGKSIGVYSSGDIKAGGTLTVGPMLALSDTPGSVTDDIATDLASGSFISYVFNPISTTLATLRLINTGITKA